MSALTIIQRKLLQPVLVTEEDVKVTTPVSANKAISTIVDHVVTSQNLHIKKALGKTLFDKLMVEFLANNRIAANLPDGTGTGTPPQVVGDTINYKELHENIFNPLCWWSYVLSLATTGIKVSEQGLLFGSTENSETAGIEGIKKLANDGSAIARSYMQILNEYIEETFSEDEDVQEESKDVGGASSPVYVSKKPWHGRSNY